MRLNFYTIDGKHRWGILPVYYVRVTFKNGHSEVYRLSEFSMKGDTFSWVRAPGQGPFRFNLSDVVSIHAYKTRWRIGMSPLLEENYREPQRRSRYA